MPAKAQEAVEDSGWAADTEEKAHRTGCFNNQCQVMICAQLYSEEWPNFYYYTTSIGDDSAPLSYYPALLSNVRTFICPSTRNEIRVDRVDRNGKMQHLGKTCHGDRLTQRISPRTRSNTAPATSFLAISNWRLTRTSTRIPRRCCRSGRYG